MTLGQLARHLDQHGEGRAIVLNRPLHRNTNIRVRRDGAIIMAVRIMGRDYVVGKVVR